MSVFTDRQLQRKAAMAQLSFERCASVLYWLSESRDFEAIEQDLLACAWLFNDTPASAFARLIHVQHDIDDARRDRLAVHSFADLDALGNYCPPDDLQATWFASACLELQTALVDCIGFDKYCSLADARHVASSITQLLVAGLNPSIKRLENKGVRNRLARKAVRTLDCVLIALDDGLLSERVWQTQRRDCQLSPLAIDDMPSAVCSRTSPSVDDLEALAEIGD